MKNANVTAFGFGQTFVLGLLIITGSTVLDAKVVSDTSPSPPITIPFTKSKPALESSDSYVLCFDVTGAAGSEVVTPKSDCGTQSASEVANGPLKAGKKLLVTLSGSTCSDFYLSLQKQSISPVDDNPVRGAPPAKPAGGTQTYGFIENAGPDGSSACYALYPDPLTSDTFTTVHISKKGAEEKPVDFSTKSLPDIHTFYRFGVSTGVAVSSLQNKTFGYTQGSTATKFTPTTLSQPQLVEPVLFLTYYPLHGGLDAEAKASWYDLGLVAGLSEKNPTSSFYFGFSTEPVRNVELIIGANATQVSVLDSSAYDAGPSASHGSPTTRSQYKFGAYIGVAFGFSNFLQQVFK